MPKWFSRIVVAGALAALANLAVPQPAVAQAFERCGDAVRIQPGDTLYQVARYCGLTIGEVMAANPRIANPNQIHIGLIIHMPGRASAALPRRATVQAHHPAAAGACGSAVTVRPGDTMARIAARCRTSVAALARANPQITNPNVIRVGQVIRMPGAVVGQPVRTDPPRLPRSDAPLPADLRVTGTVTREGVTCLAIRGDDGRLYTLSGGYDSLRIGERVQVIGRAAQSSICMQGTTIEVRELNRLGDRVQPPAGLDLTGTMTSEGVTCPSIRGDDGRLYTLAGDTGRFRPGDRVQVQGKRAEMSICMQGTTIEVSRISRV